MRQRCSIANLNLHMNCVKALDTWLFHLYNTEIIWQTNDLLSSAKSLETGWLISHSLITHLINRPKFDDLKKKIHSPVVKIASIEAVRNLHIVISLWNSKVIYQSWLYTSQILQSNNYIIFHRWIDRFMTVRSLKSIQVELKNY